MELLNIFLVFLRIGAFSFGGGYGMLPLIEQEVVRNNQWLELSEFIDVIALSQMSPGPISINAATFIGFKHVGIIGGIVGTLGVVSFSFLAVTLLASLILKHRESKVMNGIFKGIRPAVIGLIGAATVSLFQTSVMDFRTLLIGVIALGIQSYFRLHPIIIVFISGGLGILLYQF